MALFLCKLEYKSDTIHENDEGPDPEQTNPGEVDSNTHSSVHLPDKPVDFRTLVENIVQDVIDENQGPVNVNR